MLKFRKTLMLTLILVFITTTALFIVGCKKLEITEFDVPESIECTQNIEYLVPKIQAKDSKDNYIETSFVVCDKNNNSIQLVDDKFTPVLIGEGAYKITYIAKLNNEEITKVCNVNVKDAEKPLLDSKTADYVVKNREFDLSILDVVSSDNDGLAPSISYSVIIDGVSQTVENNKFTPDREGECIITIKATDSSNLTNEKVIKVKSVDLEKVKYINSDFSVSTDLEEQNDETGISFENFSPVKKGYIIHTDTEIKTVNIVMDSESFTSSSFYDKAIVVIYSNDNLKVKIDGENIELKSGMNFVEFENPSEIITNNQLKLQFSGAENDTVVYVIQSYFTAPSSFDSFNNTTEVEEVDAGEYTITDRYAVFQNGASIKATISVTESENVISVVDNKFNAIGGKTYKITFTATHELFTNNTEKCVLTLVVNNDTVLPEISCDYDSDIVTVEGEYDISKMNVVANDNIDGNITPQYTYKKNGNIVDDKNLSYGDVLEIIISATDESSNKAEKTVTVKCVDLSAKTKFKSFEKLDGIDFEAGNVSLDSTKIINGYNSSSLKINIVESQDISFDPELKIIDKFGNVGFIIFATQNVKMTSYGLRGLQVDLTKGWNFISIDKEDYSKAFYDISSDNASGAGSKYNNTVNIASQNGKYKLHFEGENAVVYIAGIEALNPIDCTDLYDFSEFSSEKFSTDFADDGSNTKRGLPYSYCESSAFLQGKSIKFSFDGENIGTETKPANKLIPYTYIKNDITKNTETKLDSFKSVTFIFEYHQYQATADKKDSDTVFIRTSDTGYFFHLKEGINLITINESDFVTIFGDSGKLNTGKYDFYFYVNANKYAFQDGGTTLRDASERPAFDLYLSGLYGVNK